MDLLAQHAPVIALVFFFAVFTGIFIWVALPRNKQRLRSYGDIPLKEDTHG